MKSRLVVIGIGMTCALLINACGSGGGTNAPTQTTINLAKPDYVTLVPILTSTTTATSTVPGQPGTVDGEQEYVVVADDYLVKIAKRYGISAQDIVDYNQWVDGFDHVIYPGLKIRIPPGATTGVVPETPSQTTTTVDTASGGTYIVADGDSLSAIAAKNGTTAGAIVRVNGWTDGLSHLIYKGLEIKLPPKAG